MIIKDRLVNVTDFIEIHPGGDLVLRQNNGRDMTYQFESSVSH